MGLEALSRGAAHATFVERAAPAIEALKKNVTATGFADRARVMNASVIGVLDRGLSDSFDVVFVDPPFADVAVLEATLAHPQLATALAPGAIVIARVLRKHPPALPTSAGLVRTKQIGEEDLLFLRYSDARGGG
jgi:16S rRNA (guanine966-N2)-methyltransferase